MKGNKAVSDCWLQRSHQFGSELRANIVVGARGQADGVHCAGSGGSLVRVTHCPPTLGGLVSLSPVSSSKTLCLELLSCKWQNTLVHNLSSKLQAQHLKSLSHAPMSSVLLQMGSPLWFLLGTELGDEAHLLPEQPAPLTFHLPGVSPTPAPSGKGQWSSGAPSFFVPFWFCF